MTDKEKEMLIDAANKAIKEESPSYWQYIKKTDEIREQLKALLTDYADTVRCSKRFNGEDFVTTGMRTNTDNAYLFAFYHTDPLEVNRIEELIDLLRIPHIRDYLDAELRKQEDDRHQRELNLNAPWADKKPLEYEKETKPWLFEDKSGK